MVQMIHSWWLLESGVISVQCLVGWGFYLKKKKRKTLSNKFEVFLSNCWNKILFFKNKVSIVLFLSLLCSLLAAGCVMIKALIVHTLFSMVYCFCRKRLTHTHTHTPPNVFLLRWPFTAECTWRCAANTYNNLFNSLWSKPPPPVILLTGSAASAVHRLIFSFAQPQLVGMGCSLLSRPQFGI